MRALVGLTFLLLLATDDHQPARRWFALGLVIGAVAGLVVSLALLR